MVVEQGGRASANVAKASISLTSRRKNVAMSARSAPLTIMFSPTAKRRSGARVFGTSGQPPVIKGTPLPSPAGRAPRNETGIPAILVRRIALSRQSYLSPDMKRLIDKKVEEAIQFSKAIADHLRTMSGRRKWRWGYGASVAQSGAEEVRSRFERRKRACKGFTHP